MGFKSVIQHLKKYIHVAKLPLPLTKESLPSGDSSRRFSLILTVFSLLGVFLNSLNPPAPPQKKKNLSSNRWSKQCERPSGPTQHVVSDNRAYLGVEGWRGGSGRGASFQTNVTWCKFLRKQHSHVSAQFDYVSNCDYAAQKFLFPESLQESMYFTNAGLHLTPEGKRGNKHRQ